MVDTTKANAPAVQCRLFHVEVKYKARSTPNTCS